MTLPPVEMTLPHVDQHREPFIEPLGHLTMQAAYADNQLYELVAASSAGGGPLEVNVNEAAHELRVWSSDAKAFAAERVSLISDEIMRNWATACIEKYSGLRETRHRAIHDAIAIGIFGTPETGYRAEPLRLEYRRTGQTTESYVSRVDPGYIAQLAMDYYKLQKDMEHIAGTLAGQSKAAPA